MSWVVDPSGNATFGSASAGMRWQLSCRSEDPSLGVVPSSSDAEEASESCSYSIRFLPVEQARYPQLEECFVRGADLVMRYPQSAADSFGVEICHRVVRDDQVCLAVESIISIQTTLLDSQPTLDVMFGIARNKPFGDSELLGTTEAAPFESMQVDQQLSKDAFSKNAVSLQMGMSDSTPPAVTRLAVGTAWSGEIQLMLPPSDRLAARIESYNPLRYRLLAEFLEKGVIRKARVWTVGWVAVPSVDEVVMCYQQLQAEPLPLTP